MLLPAWSCLRLNLDKLPADLPSRLRAARLTGQMSSFLPGGAPRYLESLASQADSRIRLLQACGRPAKTADEAASAIASATAALVDWWKVHRYVFLGEGGEPFQWRFVHSSQYGLLKQWCVKNLTDRKLGSSLAVDALVRRGTLGEQEATARVRQLWGQ